MEITLNELPQAVSQLYNKLGNIEKLLLGKTEARLTHTDELLTVEDAARFLSLAVPTIYSKISKGELTPMKPAKRCCFSKADLVKYLKEGSKKTLTDYSVEADAYLTIRNKKY